MPKKKNRKLLNSFCQFNYLKFFKSFSIFCFVFIDFCVFFFFFLLATESESESESYLKPSRKSAYYLVKIQN